MCSVRPEGFFKLFLKIIQIKVRLTILNVVTQQQLLFCYAEKYDGKKAQSFFVSQNFAGFFCFLFLIFLKKKNYLCKAYVLKYFGDIEK